MLIDSRTRNKSNDYIESMQHRQDPFAITHYRKRKHFPSYTRCTENHNKTCAENRKIRGFKFDNQIDDYDVVRLDVFRGHARGVPRGY